MSNFDGLEPIEYDPPRVTSLYEDYIRERRDLRVFKQGYAFLTWQPHGADAVYIQDIYVDPVVRGAGEAFRLANSFTEHIRKVMPQVLRFYGSCDLTSINPEPGLVAMLKYGFRMDKTIGQAIWLVKEL